MCKLVVLLLVLVLVGLTVVLSLSVTANPFVYYETASAPANVNPINITITSPTQNASYFNDGTITVCFNVTGPSGSNLLKKYVMMVDYKGDWMQDAERAYGTENSTYNDNLPYFLQFNFNITSVPLGEHSLNVTAVGGGVYIKDNNHNLRYVFTLNSSSLVNFSVAVDSKTSPSPSPIPAGESVLTPALATALIVVSVVSLVIACVVVPVYFSKRRHKAALEATPPKGT